MFNEERKRREKISELGRNEWGGVKSDQEGSWVNDLIK